MGLGRRKVMSAYKDKKTGKWFVFFYYRDWQGKNKGNTKRGFQTKREALEWERGFKQKQETNLDMSFKSFVEIYSKDMKARLKLNTWLTKENIIQTKLVPAFGNKKMNEIRPADVIAWQNKMLACKDKKGNSYSEIYLKTVHNQLSAIFNHAIRYYELKSNPAAKAGNMGKAQTKEIEFWTKEEYLKFSEVIMNKPLSFYAFEMLYWCGIRLGELLALTPADFDFEKGVVTINKSYQRLQCEDVITEPKTKTAKSNRTIQMPDFLVEEIKDYIKLLYSCQSIDRVFPITKSYLHHEMDRGAKTAGVKHIRIHDIRQQKVNSKAKILLSFLQKIFCFPFNLYAIFFKNIDFINKEVY